MGESIHIVPVVVLTAHGDECLAAELFKSGIVDYILKDADNKFVQQLPKVVRSQIEIKRKHIERNAFYKTLKNELCEKESLLQILKVSTKSSNEAAKIKDAFKPVLKEVCRSINWEIGHAYIISKDDNEQLESTAIWHVEGNVHFQRFCKVTEETKFIRGMDLPGRVRERGKPDWIVDVTKDPDFARAGIAKELGIRAGFALPVKVGAEVAAVLEFFCTKEVLPDTIFLGTMADVGIQLGRIIEREYSEEQVRKLSQAVEQSSSTVMVTDASGIIEYVNSSFTKLTGYSKEEAIGQTPRIQKSDKTPPELYKELWETITSGNEWRGEFCNKKKNEELYWEFASVSPVRNQEGTITHFIAVKEDITERKRVDGQIRASLKEKEVLLKEIHHRVKNNMQIVSSLLSLQSKNTDDKRLVNILRESQDRIKSMALIHEELYRSRDFARVNFADYVNTLTDRLIKSYAVYPDSISLDVNIDNVFLGVDAAIPCGLIINELFSNSLKHAFSFDYTQSKPEGNKGKICIGFSLDADEYTLTMSDNGIGLPDDLDLRSVKTLGLTLINMLTVQLDGTLELDRSSGTEFKITFKAEMGPG